MREVTIHDVARASRVSPSSVSNYLNGRHHQMRPETRDRIRSVIETLNYKPNSAARELKPGYAPVLGLLVPSTANQFFGELATEIELAARRYGFRILLCNTLRERDRERQFAAELISHGVKGMILGSAIRDPEGIRRLLNRGISVIAFDVLSSDIGIEGIDTVAIDNVYATQIAVQHLSKLGHRRIAYVSAPVSTIGREARLRGYQEGMARCGLKEYETVIIENAPYARSVYGDTDLVNLGRHATRRLLEDESRIPTAVIAVNDLVAFGIATGLREAGISIPDGISLVGIDDVCIARTISPSLTTVRQPLSEMAERAVALLCARMNDPKCPDSENVFKPELIVRASTAAPRPTIRAFVSRSD